MYFLNKQKTIENNDLEKKIKILNENEFNLIQKKKEAHYIDLYISVFIELEK